MTEFPDARPAARDGAPAAGARVTFPRAAAPGALNPPRIRRGPSRRIAGPRRPAPVGRRPRRPGRGPPQRRPHRGQRHRHRPGRVNSRFAARSVRCPTWWSIHRTGRRFPATAAPRHIHRRRPAGAEAQRFQAAWSGARRTRAVRTIQRATARPQRSRHGARLRPAPAGPALPAGRAALDAGDAARLLQLAGEHAAALAAGRRGNGAVVKSGAVVPRRNRRRGTAASRRERAWQPATEDLFQAARRVETLAGGYAGCIARVTSSLRPARRSLLTALAQLRREPGAVPPSGRRRIPEATREIMAGRGSRGPGMPCGDAAAAAQHYTHICPAHPRPLRRRCSRRAAISLVNEDTGFRRIARSLGPDGVYNITSLQPGSYRLVVRKEGFRTVIRFGIRLDAGAARPAQHHPARGQHAGHHHGRGHGARCSMRKTRRWHRGAAREIARLPLNGRGVLACSNSPPAPSPPRPRAGNPASSPSTGSAPTPTTSRWTASAPIPA